MGGTNDRVMIELYVDDQGTVKIQNAKVAVDELGASGKGAAPGLASLAEASTGMGGALGACESAATTLIGPLLTLAGVSLSVAGGFELVKSGLEELNTFNLGAIADAALILSKTSIQGIDAQKAAYGDYKTYVLGMYDSLEAETQRHFASGKDMIGTFNALVKEGIYASQDEAGKIGVITDAVKLLHGGSVDELTVQNEIRGVIEGHAGRYFRLAQILANQLGPSWKEIVQSHVQDGTLLTFMGDQFKGLAVAGGDIQQTMTAQSTTLGTLLGQIGRGGLGGMYQDIVGWVSQINDFLRVHKDEIIVGIVTAWERTKELVHGIYDAIMMIVNVLAVPINWTINVVGSAAKWLAAGSTPENPTGAFGAEGNLADFNAAQDQQATARKITTPEQTRIRRAEVGHDFVATKYGDYPIQQEGNVPAWHPPQQADTAGKSGDGALNSMQSLVDRLQQDISRLSEGSLAAVDAWYDKTMNEIDKLVAKGADGADAEALAWNDASLKKTKIVDDFWLMVDKQTGEGFASIDDKYQQDLVKYGDIEGAKTALLTIWQKQTYDLEQKYAKDIEDLRKSSLSALATTSPLLSDQLGFERQIMEVEINRQQIALDRKIIDDHIPAAQADELRGLNALADAGRRYAQERKEWETQGVMGGLKSFTADYDKQQETQTADMTKDVLKSIQTGLGSTIGDILVNAWDGKKGNIQQILCNIMESALRFAGNAIGNQLFGAGMSALKGLIPGLGGLTGKPTGAMSNPFYVVPLSGKGLGSYAGETSQNPFSQGGGIADMSPEAYNKVFTDAEAGLGKNADDFSGMFTAADLSQTSNIDDFTGMFDGATAGLTQTSSGFGSMFSSAISGLMGLLGGGGEGGGGGIFGMIASGVEGIASMFFHTGGVVAHSGLLVAHDGLLPDERLVKVLTGEPILQRSAFAAYQRQGLTFDDLNNGRMPVTPIPVPMGNFTTPGRQAPGAGSGTPQVVRQEHSLRLIIATPEGQVLGQHQFNLLMSETQKRLDHGELRLPARAIRKN